MGPAPIPDEEPGTPSKRSRKTLEPANQPAEAAPQKPMAPAAAAVPARAEATGPPPPPTRAEAAAAGRPPVPQAARERSPPPARGGRRPPRTPRRPPAQLSPQTTPEPIPQPSRLPARARAMSEQRDCSSDFEPLRFLGKGAFGAVVLVRRRSGPEKGRQYAMKVMLKRKLADKNQAQTARVEREILKNVRHPFLVRLCFSFQSKKRLYLLTPYYAGDALSGRLKSEGRLAVEEVQDHGARLGIALAHLHAAGVIHRDIKPANILLDARNRAHLADFGLAAYCDDAARASSASGKFAGTLDYMAPGGAGMRTPRRASRGFYPERIRYSSQAPELFLKASKTYTGAVDYWSLGVVLYECLAGRQPFASAGPGADLGDAPTRAEASARDMFFAILHSEPNLETTPEEAHATLSGLLAKGPAKRFDLDALKKHPFLAEPIEAWSRERPPSPQSPAASPRSQPARLEDPALKPYLSVDGESQAGSICRGDLFAGFAYRGDESETPPDAHPLLAEPHPLEVSGSQTSSSASSSQSSTQPRGHRRTPSDTMRSMFNAARKASRAAYRTVRSPHKGHRRAGSDGLVCSPTGPGKPRGHRRADSDGPFQFVAEAPPGDGSTMSGSLESRL